MQKVIGLAALLVVIGTVVLISFHLGSTRMLEADAASDAPKPATVVPSKNNPLFGVMADDAVVGDAKAPITIIEYASLSCPHCKAAHDTIMPELKAKYIDKGIAKFAFRHFPLNEPALRGSMLVECVGKERAPKFVDVLFELQDKWAFETDFLGSLQKIAAVGGVPQEQFSTCMTNTKIEDQIVKTRKDATDQLNIKGTPTFFLNGVEISGKMTIASFDKVIKDLQDK